MGNSNDMAGVALPLERTDWDKLEEKLRDGRGTKQEEDEESPSERLLNLEGRAKQWAKPIAAPAMVLSRPQSFPSNSCALSTESETISYLVLYIIIIFFLFLF